MDSREKSTLTSHRPIGGLDRSVEGYGELEDGHAAMETRGDKSQVTIVHAEVPESTVSIVSVPRTIEMYSVSERELDQIAGSSSALSMHLVFFGITFGAAIAFLLSMLSTELSNRQFALVWALFVLTIATVYFGIQATRGYHAAGKGVRTIKNESREHPSH